ncbi:MULTISPECIES: thiol:disulfide interchange protein DsbA/DsbL [unclassified Undibacterium]|uniref:thiol:disulfide interchange protein DsbA/DsbL n=2 Tax=Pseudomonadota TaxID=1224 RepID=UPI002AC8FDFA|nr:MULTISPECIES: thiol:disulfide interchange protein DsbA/DsbL [unclassified Undibacterium]MEB0138959.1 thiol:disulfide interchange protein DsbA/DsbL [Undibacterium sp. CCC2.1]MEB0171710.1 thiol:disulfide interchange protein DsbA/DsbL [Undibacterium sp. CCC1.1]MEB0175590.1 thiol:disulfide interchange protein DsbA/DsbL [Undibacterium sp. CCC3.4]MEB0214912.1 thiol:disulfide interchange protein DsbA/DsbL [Undibacterium sp. 5I2]WPX44897.1 thiol:disulfide interchange protein DsbA/DsbL [Undibacteriu
MRVLSQVLRGLLLLGLGFLASGAGASPAAPQSGVEYRVLSRTQPTESGKKVEVIEFFGYFCPHCNALEPVIAEWVKKQGDNIVFKRVHVNFHGLVTQQKLYFTLEAMGKTEEYHAKAFNAYHVERNRLQSDADIMEFVAKSGIDKQKFSDIYNSFAISSKLSRATQLMESYQIDSVPTIAIDGRYVTSPAQAVSTVTRVSEDQQNRAVIQVLDFLVAKAAKEKLSAAPATVKK